MATGDIREIDMTKATDADGKKIRLVGDDGKGYWMEFSDLAAVVGGLIPIVSQENKGLAMEGDYAEYINIDVNGVHKIHTVGGYLILCDKNSIGFIAEIHHVFSFVEILSQHLNYISTAKDTASKLNVYKEGDYLCLQNKTNGKLTNLYIKSIGRI